jgi:hypothetical protein
MVYAYLQLARDAEARRAIDEAMKVQGTTSRFVAPYAIAAMPASYCATGLSALRRSRSVARQPTARPASFTGAGNFLSVIRR